MIHFLEGKLLLTRDDHIVVSGQGMGWRVQMTQGLTARLEEDADGHVRVYTYMHVREDILALYGFPTHEDEQLFEILLTVTGVGPKLAQAVLDSISPDRFALAIMHEDIKTLTTVKGLGKKTAERLILELRDKLKAPDWGRGMENTEVPEQASSYSDAQGIVEALGVLGFPAQEATRMAQDYYKPELSLEDNMKQILRLAGRAGQRRER